MSRPVDEIPRLTLIRALDFTSGARYPDVDMTRRNTSLIRRILNAGALVSALVLALTVVRFHQHDASSLSHQESSCRACRIQETFSATPPTASLFAPELVSLDVYALPAASAPRVSLVPRHSSPRAPPARS